MAILDYIFEAFDESGFNTAMIVGLDAHSIDLDDLKLAIEQAVEILEGENPGEEIVGTISEVCEGVYSVVFIHSNTAAFV